MSLAIVIGIATAHATTISLDSPFGPGTITRDTTTKLDWLDVWLTLFLTSDDLANLKNGPLSGFRYATGTEVNTFVFSHFIPLPGTPIPCRAGTLSYCPLEISPILDLVNLAYIPASHPITDPADLLQPENRPEVLFAPWDSTDLSNQQDGLIDVVSMFIYNDLGPSVGYYAEIDHQVINFPITWSSGAGWPYGYFLVKPIPEPSTPEPSTLLLFCSGLILAVAMGGHRRFRPPHAGRQEVTLELR